MTDRLARLILAANRSLPVPSRWVGWATTARINRILADANLPSGWTHVFSGRVLITADRVKATILATLKQAADEEKAR